MTERGKREVQKFEYKKKRSLLDEKKAFFMIF